MPLTDRFRLDGKVALVTGAGRGIGRATAVAFAEAGADVAITARTREQLEEVAQEVEKLGRRCLVHPADVRDTANLEPFVEEALSALGRIDVVVNNVGGSVPRPFLQTKEKHFQEAFHWNAMVAFSLSKLTVPHMLEVGGGSIVNISSVIGQITGRGFTAYGMGKAAMTHMTKLMAQDLAPRIRVNAIAVGSTATSALETVLTNDSLRERMVADTPLKRLGEPEDIALGALYLASPAAAFMTGSVLELHGGIQMANLAMDLPDL